MRRRDFLSTVALGPLLAATNRTSTPQKLVRAAIVIGVDKTGTLPVLKAAVSGANQFGDWLQSEQFEVHRFVTHPVVYKPILAKIAELVDRGTLDQLVVYFSGHGFLKDGSEMWLLSGAPADPNEAISLREGIDLARETAVPSVVFISDACRSAPTTLSMQRVRGSVIFPNPSSAARPRGLVDRFFAALPGDPALELPTDTSAKTFESIYTSSFLDAFKNPTSTMIATVAGIQVVPNQSLKPYLVADVARRAAAKSLQLQQYPDAILECDASTYIGRVVRPKTPAPILSPPATVVDLTARELARVGLKPLVSPDPAVTDKELQQVATRTGFDTERRNIIAATAPPSFETRTGFAVIGSPVVFAVSSPGMRAELLAPGDGDRNPAIIRIVPQSRRAASVAFRFPDGSGAIVAALEGYIGAITVTGGRVASLTYTPSQTDPRWDPGDYKRVHELRATVATAARFGTFRIEGSGATRTTNAAALAEAIRAFKAIDPSLGLYAAYAYAEAGIDDQVRSVGLIMRGDLGVDLFDVAMLSGALAGRTFVAPPTPVPLCPMLSQGWGWLRVRNVVVPPYLDKARDYLRPALWTTLEREGMDIMQSVIITSPV